MKFVLNTPSAYLTKVIMHLAEKHVKSGHNLSSYELEYEFNRLRRAETMGGAVLAERTKSESVKVMSDIWEMQTDREVLVWAYEKEAGMHTLRWIVDGSYTTGCSHMFDEITCFHAPQILTESVWAQINTWIEEESWKAAVDKACKESEYDIRKNAAQIARGTMVEVVSGRKVKVGTKGKVVTVSDGKWGARVGIALDDQKDARGWHTNVAWTALSNVRRIVDEAAIEKDIAEAKAHHTARVTQQVKASWYKTLEEHRVLDPIVMAKLAVTM